MTSKERMAWREEIFGPVVCVRAFDTEAEALALANDNVYGLASAVFTSDEGRADRFEKGIRAGIVWKQCSQPCFCQMPWGGYRSRSAPVPLATCRAVFSEI